MNREKRKAEERDKKLKEDQYYDEKLARERQIMYERYEQEKQRDIQLKAKAFSNQEPFAIPETLSQETESKKGILKVNKDNKGSKKSLRFEGDEPNKVPTLQNFQDDLNFPPNNPN
jgi:hypothetical protein